MQFIESTIFGVRSAYWVLSAGDDAPIIHLLPMVHIGDQEFYDQIKQIVANFDAVIVEGVRSPSSRVITLSYRWAIENPKIGMVLQNKIKPEDVKGEIIHGDVSGKKFENKWARLGIFLRLKIYFLAPLYGLFLRFFGTRAYLAKTMGTEYAQSRSDILTSDEDWEDVQRILLDWRDLQLIKTIKKEIRGTRKRKNIGIVYGAEHMKAVVKYLMDIEGYRVIGSQWLTLVKL